jgi:uncharacterized membrane protein YgcG
MRTMIKSLAIIFISLVLLIPSVVLASSDSDLKVFVGGGLTVHEIDLKATKMGNGQVVPVSNFAIEPEDVVQINKDRNLMVTLSTNDVNRIDRVKVVDADGVTTELTRQGNVWSIQNLEVGTYLLNVIVDTEGGQRQAGYETILVVLKPGEKAESPNTVINKVNQWVIVKIKTVFVFPPERPEPPECPEGFALGADGKCIPICDVDTPPGTTCYDEGDEDDQNGCLAHEGGCDPEPCTPDGPPCPPCPEGVEANWCQDEDEQQDTDEELQEEEVEEDEVGEGDEIEETEEEDSGGVDEDEGSSGSGDGSGGDGSGGDGSGGDNDNIPQTQTDELETTAKT